MATRIKISDRLIPELAFWIILSFFFVAPLFTTVTLCQEPLSSNTDLVVCIGTTWACALVVMAISALCTNLPYGSPAEACVLLNLIGIGVGLPAISHIESWYTAFAAFASYVVLFEVPYVCIMRRVASKEVYARFATMLYALLSGAWHQELKSERLHPSGDSEGNALLFDYDSSIPEPDTVPHQPPELKLLVTDHSDDCNSDESH